jgi:stress-induced morphogen
MTPQAIRKLILKAFPDAEVELEDLTGGGDHWKVRVVSRHFLGLPMLKCHRLVYGALGDAMKGPIHALALTTASPEASEDG